MENNKVDDNLGLLESVFDKQDYKEFLVLARDNQEKILNINTYPVDNYSNKTISSIHLDTLCYLYQNMKYYLQTKNDYAPKMQEGIALFASKVAIMNAYYPGSIDNYFKTGDGSLYHELCNPFEEIVRLLLSATKDEYRNNPNKIKNDYVLSFDKLRFENNACLQVVKEALNGKKMINKIDLYYTSNIVKAIEKDLETSNITSFEPFTATTKDNRALILEQINRIIDLYHEKVDAELLMGDITNAETHDKLLSRFDNRVFYAKRNIGIYERTKELVKEC